MISRQLHIQIDYILMESGRLPISELFLLYPFVNEQTPLPDDLASLNQQPGTTKYYKHKLPLQQTTDMWANPERRNLFIAYLIQQFIASCKVLFTNSNILLSKRHRTIARIKEEESCLWIHSQKLCHLGVHEEIRATSSMWKCIRGFRFDF